MEPITSRWIACAAAAFTLAGAAPVGAAAPRVDALTGARIVVEPGRILERGTLVLRDGLIEAVGPDVAVPADATLHDCEGLTVYAGLIEPYAPRPRPEGGQGMAAPQGGHPNPLVRPEHSVTAYAADAETARRLRQAGFTTALVTPAEGIFRGSGALLNLGDGAASDNLLGDGFGQFTSFERAAAGYPRSLMGAVALFRQTVLDAAWYAAARRAYAAASDQPRPRFDRSLAALEGVSDGEELVVLATDDAIDTLRAAALVEELGLEAWVVGNGEEYQWLESIGASGLPHLLPVSFPERPPVPDQDDLTVKLAELRHWQEAPANPARLLGAGLTVAFTSHGLSDPKELHARLARAMEQGLTADQALAALTTTPARMLGLADRAGSVTPGKMANLVVVEGELFAEETRVREVWIDGLRYEIKEVEPPEVEPAGSWRLTAETPEGELLPALLELQGKAPSLEGTIAVGEAPPLPLSSATVSGKAVEIAFDGTQIGLPGVITFTLEVEGLRAVGNGVSPNGPFTISGSRADPPEVAP